jgi:hypothetical protein
MAATGLTLAVEEVKDDNGELVNKKQKQKKSEKENSKKRKKSKEEKEEIDDKTRE